MKASAIMGTSQASRRASVGKSTCPAGTVLLAVTLVAGCAPHFDARGVDPEVDFAAHVDHSGLVIDRMGHDSPAVLVPHGWLFSRGPNFLLRFNDQTIAALWLDGTNHITVRRADDPDAPVIGRVDASWQLGAIRLAFQPSNGAAYSTGRFHRVDTRLGEPAFLGEQVSTNRDLRGVYQAEVRDAQGTTIGWLRARIETYPGSPRVYDGILPEQLDGPLAAAAVELVNADVDDVERRTSDVYQGN